MKTGHIEGCYPENWKIDNMDCIECKQYEYCTDAHYGNPSTIG